MISLCYWRRVIFHSLVNYQVETLFQKFISNFTLRTVRSLENRTYNTMTHYIKLAPPLWKTTRSSFESSVAFFLCTKIDSSRDKAFRSKSHYASLHFESMTDDVKSIHFRVTGRPLVLSPRDLQEKHKYSQYFILKNAWGLIWKRLFWAFYLQPGCYASSIWLITKVCQKISSCTAYLHATSCTWVHALSPQF